MNQDDDKTSKMALEEDIAGKIPSVVDVRWKLGVTASNDEVKVVGKCFVQVKLLLDSGPLYIEMSASEFFEFLAGLEKLNLKMDTLEN